MIKQNQKIGFLVALTVFCAVLFRVLGKITPYYVPFGMIRTMIYIGLYIGWGISVSQRVIQEQVRHYLVSVSGLMVFWFVIRSMKYFFIADTGIARQLWYWYYLPMLFIPLFSVFVAISLGKPKNFKLSKKTLLLYIPTVLCLLLVLTNDLHQLVFTFPAGEVWSDKNNGYEWIKQQFIDIAFTYLTSVLFYEDYDTMTSEQRLLMQQGMEAFGGNAPTYRIALLDKPTIVWDFHSLMLGIQMMFSFRLSCSAR